jgi:formate/nitrite transporter
MMPPQATLETAANAGLMRGMRPAGVIFASSVMGGCFLSFGGMMFASLAGGTPLIQETLPGLHTLLAASVFPIGLSMVVFTGSDLLTSNMLYHSLPFFTHPHRNVNLKTVGQVWTISFAGNLLGSLVMASCAASAMVFSSAPYSTWITAVAVKKCGYTFTTALLKGVAANWLVNVAVFMSLSSRSSIGKLAALWIPITTFVTLGFEHSVANMFLGTVLLRLY